MPVCRARPDTQPDESDGKLRPDTQPELRMGPSRVLTEREEVVR